jgi:hypothetical protein
MGAPPLTTIDGDRPKSSRRSGDPEFCICFSIVRGQNQERELVDDGRLGYRVRAIPRAQAPLLISVDFPSVGSRV